ncbi:hypothetical protein DYU05_17535 [Mucilaginibacter terrenus]|uniref:Uncharacterized protein n=1 Tax=Mucilaginibacter terrenus TaxID=2482727 RepID=A0A3E2NKY4_9SPHI|nr:hypothetical protein DYU05_17535 [Mucilaginibacter terrenus]
MNALGEFMHVLITVNCGLASQGKIRFNVDGILATEALVRVNAKPLSLSSYFLLIWPNDGY